MGFLMTDKKVIVKEKRHLGKSVFLNILYHFCKMYVIIPFVRR